MKCQCEECDGRGYIPCEGCDGDGEVGFEILTAKFREHTTRNYGRVMECQSAARDVVRQKDALSEIFPQNRAKYEQQAVEIIAQLDKEAEGLMSDKKEGAA
jgi:ABC-type Zn uptake system ZnuABC Zn-binding protein ZnuA